jgi:hypothetical protein
LLRQHFPDRQPVGGVLQLGQECLIVYRVNGILALPSNDGRGLQRRSQASV